MSKPAEDHAAPAPQRTARRLPIIDALARMAARLRRPGVPSGMPRDRYRQAALVAAAAAVTIALAGLSLLSFDAASVAWAHSLSPGAAGFFRGITRFGKSDWYLIPTAVLTLLLLSAEWRRASPLVRFAWAELAALVGYFFFAVVIGGIFTDLIKWALGRSRPVLFLSDGILTLHPLSFGYSHNSFPSGHATTVAAATIAIVLISRRWAVPMAILGVAIAVSRVAVGAHYPSDVIAGLFIGGAYAYGLAYWLANRRVAFRVDSGGHLRPRTGALRRALARPGGAKAMLAGFAAALLPRRPAS